MNNFLIIDGSSLVNRAFYALPPLTNKKGVQTNAIYGFIRMYKRLVEEYKPELVAVLFDPKGPTFRHKMYDGYKSTRKKFPPELSYQISILKDLLDEMGIRTYEVQGYEADDLAGSLSKKYSDNYNVVLVTGDRDYLQLVDDNVKVIYTKRGISETVDYDRQMIMDDYGLTPDQLIDLKALMGDKSDDIPGIDGIGEVTAKKLLHEYKTLDGVYDNIDNMKKNKTTERIANGKDAAYLSKELGRIKCDVEVESKDYFKLRDPNTERVNEIFSDLEFQDFTSGESKDDKIEVEYKIVDSFKNIKFASKTLAVKQFFRNSYHNEEPLAYGIFDGERAYISESANDFYEIFDEKYDFIGGNIKEDLYHLIKKGINKNGFKFDVVVGDYLVDPTSNGETISAVYGRYFSSATNYEDLFSKNKKTKIEEFDKDELFNSYAVGLAQIYKLYPVLEDRIKSMDMTDLLNDIELPLTYVLANMEYDGVEVKKSILEDLGKQFQADLDQMEEKIFELAGEEFNINSPKQLGEILFNKLELPVIKKTKTGFSTDQEVLEKLSDKHPLPKLILEYRQDSKLKSTYVDGIVDIIDEDGRLRSTFNQVKTATGRISSTEPNLQNIPTRTEKGRMLRKAFVAKDGHQLLDLDYSQIELRVLAAVSKEEKMIEGFHGDLDIHRKTASEVFDIPYDEVTDMERYHAKAVNFGIVYGISDYGLSRNLDIGRDSAKEYIDNYWRQFPNVKKYMDDVVEGAKKDGYVTTLFNRRRAIHELNSKNFNIRSFGERIALNTPIQGTAADIIKIAMVKVFDYLRENKMKSRLILTIHDELILEAADDEVDKLAKDVKHIMETVTDMGVDLKVDYSIAKDWYEA